jgi:hypothetical protein
MSYIYTIEEVQEELFQWRQNKKFQFEAMPKSIKAKIIELTQHHTQSKIMRTLHLSSTFINNLKQRTQLTQKSKVKLQDLNFVKYKIVPESQHNDDYCANFDSSKKIPDSSSYYELVKPSGIKLLIHNTDPKIVISAFLCFN